MSVAKVGKLYRKLVDLPEEFNQRAMRFFAPNSVALARMRGNNPETFTSLGTGVLVQRKNRFGILTAHHCLHACNDETSFGPDGKDTLMLAIGTGRSAQIEPRFLFEHPLGTPNPKGPYGPKAYKPFGPDLTFLEIVPSGALTAMDGFGSFYDLNKSPGELKKKFTGNHNITVTAGFPQGDYEAIRKPRCIDLTLRHMAYFNAIKPGDVVERNGWDYLNSTVFYGKNNHLPETFGGVSGAAVWSMDVQLAGLKIKSWALVGIIFWESGIMANKERNLRAHFIDSIYSRGWADVPFDNNSQHHKRSTRFFL